MSDIDITAELNFQAQFTAALAALEEPSTQLDGSRVSLSGSRVVFWDRLRSEEPGAVVR